MQRSSIWWSPDFTTVVFHGYSSVLCLSLPQQRIRTCCKELTTWFHSQSFFIQPLNLTELHRKSPEVVAQRNLVKIKSRSFLGTLSQKESFISTEPARNQPSYFEKLNSTIHQDYFGEPTHEAKIDNNLNSE